MKIEIEVNDKIEPGSIYLIPRFIRCVHCEHEIPIGMKEIHESIIDIGGCGRKSYIQEYAKYFGLIKNVKV